jgi:hypothetical protein
LAGSSGTIPAAHLLYEPLPLESTPTHADFLIVPATSGEWLHAIVMGV